MSPALSILLAATIDRQRAAAQQIGDVVVPRAQPGPGIDHEHGGVGVRQRGPHLIVDQSGQLGSVLRSTPPVSISVSGLPFHSVRSSLRSRVTPGASCTTASRLW